MDVWAGWRRTLVSRCSLSDVGVGLLVVALGFAPGQTVPRVLSWASSMGCEGVELMSQCGGV